jgi:hypothetical protein
VTKPAQSKAQPANASARDWMTGVFVTGILYVVISRVFSWPRENAIAWRWATWIVAGIIFIVHILAEHFGSRSAPKLVATRAALGVGIGAVLVALAGLTTTLMGGNAVEWGKWALAFVGFPAITAIPAFVVAFLLAKLLSRRR